MGTSHFSGLNIKLGAIADSGAGAFTLTGIRQEDSILAVIGVTITLGEATPNTIALTTTDLTSEFTITGDDEIDNTSGTSLVDTLAYVLWLDKDAS